MPVLQNFSAPPMSATHQSTPFFVLVSVSQRSRWSRPVLRRRRLPKPIAEVVDIILPPFLSVSSLFLSFVFSAFCRSLTLFHAFEKFCGVFKALFLGFIDYTWHRYRCFIGLGVSTVALSCGRLRNWWKFCAINELCSIHSSVV